MAQFESEGVGSGANGGRRPSVRAAAAVLAAAWLIVYAPTVPGGFIKDDFAWVLNSRLESWASVYALLADAEGFYRPLVSLSFGVTEALFAGNPVPYALTNVALALACSGAVYTLGTTLALPAWAALLAAAIWAFNFHGINMAVVWVSGRTSLLATLFALLSAVAFVRRRALGAALLCFAALMAKEEVLALPFILTLWQWLDTRPLRAALPLWAALAVYLALRVNSGAFGPTDAPAFYQFSSSPEAILTNVIHYADRSMTFGLLVGLGACLALRVRPRPGADDRVRLMKGAAWLAGGFALTLWLPVRSSLYAVFPSVGFAICAATLVRAAAAAAPPARYGRLAVAGLVIPFLLLPVYWSRNVRWTELRELTSATFAAIAREPQPPGTLIVLEDDLSTRANFRNAFGAMFPEAARLYLREDVSLWIEPPPPEYAGPAVPRSEAARTLTLRLSGGRVQPSTRSADERGVRRRR